MEIAILSTLKHPNFANLIEAFETPTHLYMILELKRGGELFNRLVDRGAFSEEEAKPILQQIGRAIAYLHRKGVVHRDVKPENMLFNDSSEDSDICLADFGFATFLQETTGRTTPLGTIAYAAPEIVDCKTYNKGVDMWSLGVILYSMLAGFPPFWSQDNDTLIELIREGDIKFPHPFWDHITEEAKDLVSHLLDKNPIDRYNAEEFLGHQWFRARPKIPSIIIQPPSPEMSARKAELKQAFNTYSRLSRELIAKEVQELSSKFRPLGAEIDLSEFEEIDLNEDHPSEAL